MSEHTQFRHGLVEYPLTSATTNSLLKDADPALFEALAYFSTILDTYVGARLKAQALIHGIKINAAVAGTLALEPTPDLLAENFRFPLFCIWRTVDVDSERSTGWDHDVGEWAFAYVLPVMTPKQKVEITPILRSVGRVISRGIRQDFDPTYQSGKLVWAACGVEALRLKSINYGTVEAMNQEAGAYRAIVGVIEVKERDDIPSGAFQDYAGVDAVIDLKDPVQQTVIANFEQFSTLPAPTLLPPASPQTGTRAGGTTVTLTGTNFRVGTTPMVSFGGVKATSVVVISTTSLTCVTPAHDAFTSYLSDIVVTNIDGQSATMMGGYTFT